MMKKILFFVSIAAVAVISSCSKNNVAPESDVQTVKIAAALPDVVRTHLDNLACKWSEGDQIVVNGETSTSIDIKGDGSYATFTLPVVDAPYCGLYPASAYVAGSYDPANSKYGSVTLPATQNYTAGSYDPAAAILLGKQETAGKGIGFANAMAYLKFTVNAGTTTANIKSIQLESYGSENLSGTFTIDGNYTTLTNTGKTKTPVTLNCGESGVALGTSMIIAIPAKTYAQGFSIKIVDVEGKYQVAKTSVEFVAAAGTIYPTTLTFVPQGTLVDGEIYTVADWNNFVAQVGSGDDFSGKTVTIKNDLTVETYLNYYKGTFNGTLDGGNHTVTVNANKWPLFEILGSDGIIKDLTIAGNIGGSTATQSAVANPGEVGNAVFVKQNRGKITNCKNTTNTTLPKITGAVIFGCFCAQNAGILEDCVNEGNITIAGTCASVGLYGGGLAAAGHGLVQSTKTGPTDVDPNLPSGQFIRCTNKGNIELTLTGGATPPVKCAIGGICGVAFKDGVTFTGCVNEGEVAKYDKGVSATNNANCVGGICGRAAATNTDTNLAVDPKAGYKIDFTNCTNKGAVINLSRISSTNYALNAESGARKSYFGGIAGMIVGSNTDASKRATISGCKNYGDIAGGWNGVSSNTPGALAGCATNVNVSDCTVSCKIYSSATDKASSSANRYITVAGGVAGVTYGNLVVSGGTVYTDGTYAVGTDKWEGLLLGLNYGSGTSFDNIAVGGTISRGGTSLDINATTYTTYCLGAKATTTGTVAPAFTNLTYVSTKPEQN